MTGLISAICPKHRKPMRAKAGIYDRLGKQHEYECDDCLKEGMEAQKADATAIFRAGRFS
jgi:hypothetical protein